MLLEKWERHWSERMIKSCFLGKAVELRVYPLESYIPAHTFQIRDGEICHSSFHEVLFFQNMILLCFKMKCPAKKESWKETIHVFLETSKGNSNKCYNLNVPRYWYCRSTTILQRPSVARPSEQGTGGVSGTLGVEIRPSSTLSSLSLCFLHKLI